MQVFDDLRLDPATDSSQVTETLRRLRAMAVAWATPHTSTYRSDRLLHATTHGLSTVYDQVYRNAVPDSSWTNWWDRAIGCPQILSDCLVLLNEVLPGGLRGAYAEAIARAVRDVTLRDSSDPDSPPATGANLLDHCRTAVIHGLVTEDTLRISQGADALRLACRFANEGDGLHPDGSFLQHTVVPYTGAYGVTWLDGVSRIAWLLSGTHWKLDQASLDVVQFAVDQAFAPAIHNGRLMSFVRGREISREQTTEHSTAATAMAAMLRLAELSQFPRPTTQSWKNRCLGWTERSRPGYDPFQGTDVPTAQAFDRLLDAGEAVATPEPDSSVVLSDSGRAVHRRSGWAFAVSMSAEHVARYEVMNGENILAAHTGAGMTYLYDDDDTQFTDHFWPTVDPNHLPGTTVVQVPIALDQRMPSPVAHGAWAGGAVLDKYSALSMTISGATAHLTGCASWFCFDDYVFALGTGIRSDTMDVVETTVENRLFHDGRDAHLTVDGEPAVREPGEVQTWNNPSWAHLEGVGGYIFVGDARVRAAHERHTGRWRDVNEAGDAETISRTYVSIVIDHGARPTDAGYAYLVLPGATPSETAALAEQRDIWIGAARPAYHLVSQDGRGITMATFLEPGQVPGLRTDAPCSVVIHESTDGLALAVADLARRADPIRLVLTGKGNFHAVAPDQSVPIRSIGADLEITVHPVTPGATVVARFQKQQ